MYTMKTAIPYCYKISIEHYLYTKHAVWLSLPQFYNESTKFQYQYNIKNTHIVPSWLLLDRQWPHGNSCT